MTQPNKPEKKQEIEYDPDNASWGNADDSYSHGSDVGEVYGFNQAIEEMEAYYQPIVKELVEALDYLQRMSIIAYSRIDGGTYDLAQAIEEARQALAKYKKLK